MQVFVKKTDLTASPSEGINVIATYDDGVQIDPAAHGSDATVLSLPTGSVKFVTEGNFTHMRLAGDWRTMVGSQLVSTEASKRINAVFPDYSQRNSIAEIDGYIMRYGADSNKWPSAERQRKAEFDRCWGYVNSVRAAATKLANTTADPTADASWPTHIGPYQPAS